MRLYNLCHRKGIALKGDQTLALALLGDTPEAQIPHMRRQDHDATAHHDEVPPEHTADHTIYVAGSADKPWIWCTKCGTYTNRNVRNLAKECKSKGNTLLPYKHARQSIDRK